MWPLPTRKRLILLLVMAIGLGISLACTLWLRHPPRGGTCEVHHVPLEYASLPVYYDMYIDSFNPEFDKAFVTLFPHSSILVTKRRRFLVDPWFDRQDSVLVCPKCVQARKSWKPSTPTPLPSPQSPRP